MEFENEFIAFKMSDLMIRELNHELNADEKAELQNWLNASVANQQLYDEFATQGGRAAALAEIEQYQVSLALLRVEQRIKKESVKLLPRVAGIAAAVAAITLGVWLYYASNTARHLEGSALSSRVSRDLNDIAPGGNKATIKIGDGEAITLSDKQTGVIVGANNLTYNDNTLVIQSGPLSSRTNGLSSRANAKDPSGLGMTTITTPRGGTYQITLPDGTKVWLNAASVLTYTMPLKERGGVRLVKLIGEAYFEVFRNKNQPFVVTTKNLTTTVLGTHFNISAYADENSTKATLLEGSVRVTTLSSRANAKDLDSSYPRNDKGVSNDERSLPAVRDDGDGVTLKPNQQASITNNTSITVKQVDASETIAWKSGKFSFEREEMGSIMRKVARWYNVDVVFKDPLQQVKLTGSISRFENVSKLLEMLEYTKEVHFKIEGRKVYVTK